MSEWQWIVCRRVHGLLPVYLEEMVFTSEQHVRVMLTTDMDRAVRFSNAGHADAACAIAGGMVGGLWSSLITVRREKEVMLDPMQYGR